jgi:hypothetical protein
MKKLSFFLIAWAVCWHAAPANEVLLSVDLHKSIMEDRYAFFDPQTQAMYEEQLSQSVVAAIQNDGRWSKFIWRLEPARNGATLDKKDHLLVTVTKREDERNFVFNLAFKNRAGLVEDLAGAAIYGEGDLLQGAPPDELGEKLGNALTRYCFSSDKLHQHLCQHVPVGKGRVGISATDDTGAIYLRFDEYERFSNSIFQFKCAKGGKLLTTRSCGTGVPLSATIAGMSLVCLGVKHTSLPMGMVADDEADVLMLEFQAIPLPACGAGPAGAAATTTTIAPF